jgi:oleate hydratase
MASDRKARPNTSSGYAIGDPPDFKAYLVGGGIASMSAAVFMIRDGGVAGSNITIFEETEKLGGSLDGAGTPDTGYITRGGRMMESHYACTFGLFASIPTLDTTKTVTQEIFDWNKTMPTSSNSRLMRNGEAEAAPAFGLKEREIIALETLAVLSEASLGKSSIADHFHPAFFKTNFWFMWCTTFAFQPWHSVVEFKRYMLRFMHMIGGFNRLEGILRTVLNQYESMVLPLQKWLVDQGVRFEMNTRVTDLDLRFESSQVFVASLETTCVGEPGSINVEADDIVLVTLGSMTEGAYYGTNDQACSPRERCDGGGAWSLWRGLAQGLPEFGRPEVFASHVEQSKWLSFTTTFHSPFFLNIMQDRTGNVPGEGGLVTFPDSNWLMSIVIPHQPHFSNQSEDVTVLWGYGLTVDAIGNYVKKPMAACSGREIMTELLSHLRLDREGLAILAHCICLPCMMPYVTSQFLPREPGDRPEVIPPSSGNFGFVGQFCEQPDDVVFTVEYSIRSAQTAVSKLLGLGLEPPPVYRGELNPGVLFRALKTLHKA